MSKTPRTHNAVEGVYCPEFRLIVPAELAYDLESENAALRADKERLDWLQKSTCWSHPPFGEDIRVAIDAARKEAQ